MSTDRGPVTLREILGGVPFFRELTPGELDRITALGRLVSYPKDAALFKEGDPGEALYIVVDGSVRIGKVVPGAKEEAMAFMEQGSCFGEMALFDESPDPPPPSPTRSAGCFSWRNTPSWPFCTAIRSSRQRSSGPSAGPSPSDCARRPTAL